MPIVKFVFQRFCFTFAVACGIEYRRCFL